jgi:hypothetical protein
LVCILDLIAPVLSRFVPNCFPSWLVLSAPQILIQSEVSVHVSFVKALEPEEKRWVGFYEGTSLNQASGLTLLCFPGS